MTAIDEGLLSPVSAGHDDTVRDAAVLAALVTVEAALTRAWGRVGAAPSPVVDEVSAALGWAGTTQLARDHGVDVADLSAKAVAGGNPVIPLVGVLKGAVSPDAKPWIHRGATSQDILDSALVLVSARAVAAVLENLRRAAASLRSLAEDQRDTVAAARTLTQHGVPTTVGLRAVSWLRGVERAIERLDQLILPAQLGGAGGTLASLVELADAETATLLPAALAAELGLAAPDAPWHTTRWPITELGDALVQTLDALGKLAGDVATGSRTEIGELAEASGGGSSAMPQKQNPVASVLLRSAALRAPALGSTLHLAAALAADERPDGAWHAEWPTLRELLRLALGASATAASLVSGLRVDRDAIARNLELTGGLIVAERLSLVLTPIIGRERVTEIVAAAGAGGSLRDLVGAAVAEAGAAVDVDALLDPAGYTGLAGRLVDEATGSGTGAGAATGTGSTTRDRTRTAQAGTGTGDRTRTADEPTPTPHEKAPE